MQGEAHATFGKMMKSERVTRLAILVLDERFLVGAEVGNESGGNQKCPALVSSVGKTTGDLRMRSPVLLKG